MPETMQVKFETNEAQKPIDTQSGSNEKLGLRESPTQMIDRSAPRWALPLSWFFSTSAAICLLSLCVLTVFFADLASSAKEPFMAILLMGVGLIPVIGWLIFEFAHAKALSGYRVFRERANITAQAFVAVVAFLLLELVHPILGLAIPLGFALNWAFIAGFSKINRKEPLWDFLPEEAVSVLSGRDETGRKLAQTSQQDHSLLNGALAAVRWFSLVVAFGVASWLAAKEILSPAAVAGVGLISMWAVAKGGAFFKLRKEVNPLVDGLAATVDRFHLNEDEVNQPLDGLQVQNLSVVAANGVEILSNVNFCVEPGQVLGVLGPPGSGKTTLLKTLIGPYDMTNLGVRGAVFFNEIDLWDRTTNSRSVPAVFLPSEPLILSTSGRNNLSFFNEGSVLERGKRTLEQMVFASDIVEKICDAPDASLLSGSEKKALAFARGFLMSPPLYLFDRPEDSVSEKVIGALAARIRQECRAGRSFVIVTENRALLDICDKLLVMQEGRVIDFGQAMEIRQRQSSGWHRFVGSRRLDTEENLEAWVRSHFRRDGDEVNRRNACVIAAEMLAFSCQNVTPLNQQSIAIEFKHFEGHCLIKLIDRDVPVSSGVLQRAIQDAEAEAGLGRLSPLATIHKLSAKVEATVELDQRVLLAQLDTYDPRKTGGKVPSEWKSKNSVLKASDDASIA